MNFAKNWALSVSVFALAIGLGASQANAESLRGTFNLPYQAHWGRVVLEPGEYVLRLSTQPSMLPVLYISGQGKTVMVLAGTSGATDFGRSYLRIENIGDAHVVREFHSGVGGKLYTFSIPKSVKKQVELASNARDTTIPVAPPAGK